MLDAGAPDATGSQMLANASLNETVVGIDASIGIDALTRVFEETDVVDRIWRDPELDRAWVGDCKNERGK